MTSKRSALFAVAFAATFVVGAAIGGAAVSFRTIPPMAVMVARANLVMVGKDAYVMYRYAAYPVARNALLKYSDQSQNSVSTVPAESEGTSFDVGLTYGRLALAAERAGNQSDVDTFMNLAKEAFGRTRRSYDEAQIRAAVERLDKAWDEGLAGRPGQGQRSPIRRRTKRWSRRDERPALHWSVRAVTAQREALAGQNLFHAWMCLAGGIKDDKRGAFTYDIWASAHRSVSKEAPARTRKHTSESKVWVQRRRESS